MNYQEIKTEYLSGDTTYRKLAAKYGVSLDRLQRIGAKENWTALRRQAKNRAEEQLALSLAEKNAVYAEKIIRVADQILEKISCSLDSMTTIDGNTLKHFTAALKELRDIKGIKSEADIREQEIRIENLRRAGDKDTEPTTIEVVFKAGEEDWNE